MFVIPRIPVVTFIINRICKVKDGKYQLYKDTRVIRKITNHVWYECVDFKRKDYAKNFVKWANSL